MHCKSWQILAVGAAGRVRDRSRAASCL